jgi:hypothetical protein
MKQLPSPGTVNHVECVCVCVCVCVHLSIRWCWSLFLSLCLKALTCVNMVLHELSLFLKNCPEKVVYF